VEFGREKAFWLTLPLLGLVAATQVVSIVGDTVEEDEADSCGANDVECAQRPLNGHANPPSK
jgi:hypothetical protein